MFSILPQELVREIISFVPEYGFMVCKSIHVDLIKMSYSFYCDTRRFICIHDLPKTEKEADINMSMKIVNTYKKNTRLSPDASVDSEDEDTEDESSEDDTDTDDETIDYGAKKYLSSMHDFEPIAWAAKIFKQNHFAIFCKVFHEIFPKTLYGRIMRTHYIGPTINDLVLHCAGTPEIFKSAVKLSIKRACCFMLAYKNGILNSETTICNIGYISEQSGIPNFMSILAVVIRNMIYDTFIELYYGKVTAEICKDIFTNINEVPEYNSCKKTNHYYKLFETLGCHLVAEKSIQSDKRLYKYYLASTIYRNMDETQKGVPNSRFIDASRKLAEFIIQNPSN